MRRTLNCTAILIATCVVASAQVVKVEPHAYASDVWGKYFSSGHKITFSGRVTGIEITKTVSGGDNEVTLLVKNKEGGGTSVVDVGPQWYVDHQVAKIKLKDKVQVTGSKVLIDGQGIVLASMIRVNGQGGLVVSLRRQSGKAFWMGTDTTETASIPSGSNTITGTISNVGTYTRDNVVYSDAVVQTGNGLVTVDLGPQWYYQRQDADYQVGNNVSVVAGPDPYTLNSNTTVYPGYVIVRGSNIYNIRSGTGQPLYYWGNN